MTDGSPKPPFKAPTQATEWILVFGSLALSMVLAHFVGEGRGFVAGTSVFAIIFLVQISWRIRNENWFWFLTALFAAVHGWLAFQFDWSWLEQGSNLKLLGVAWTLDVGAMAAIIYGIYRHKHGAPAISMEESDDTPPRYNDRNISL